MVKQRQHLKSVLFVVLLCALQGGLVWSDNERSEINNTFSSPDSTSSFVANASGPSKNLLYRSRFLWGNAQRYPVSSFAALGSGGGSTPAGTDDLEKISKMSSNPIGAAWMLWLQNDYTRISGNAVSGGRYVNSTKFQPVMSFPVEVGGEDWNLLVRPVIQYQSVPLRESFGETLGLSPGAIAADPRLSAIAADPWGRTSGLGDTALLTLLGPNRLDGTIWGVGATQIFPTASQEVLGSEKWAAGPAFLLASLAPKPGGFNFGALAQHWWSYAGEDDRESISLTNIQYFINYRLSKTELVGMTPNITYDWNADDSDDALALPVGIGYSNVIKIGKLPVRIAIEYQYYLVQSDSSGEDWNIRFMFIPVIPNPFRKAAY